MATTLPCQSDDGNVAIFTGTNLLTGDSVTVCEPCMVQFFATVVEALSGVPVTQFLEIAADPTLEVDEAKAQDDLPVTTEVVAHDAPEANEVSDDDAHSTTATK